tara:strand:+ start:39 stop:1376 length:1338 start_codon:yes stop_codon:yes gene_type:complete
MPLPDPPFDTIVALASGSTPAGVAVLRLSGAAAPTVLQALTKQPLPDPRRMVLRSLYAPESGELLDRGLVVRFAAPNSFTGEDVVELHLHGGPATVSGTLAVILAFADCRQAREGEFTRRAFDNGKLDLTAVEGLSDLVRARTAAQRRQALSAAGGATHRTILQWRDSLLRARALLETMIDFVDEDVPDHLLANARSTVAAIRAEMADTLDRAQAGLAIRDGLHVAIAGAPNVGKSTLLNALVGRDAAIVSAIAGTTRDVIEATLDIDGYLVIVSDTAGLREAASPIEAEGIRRANRAMAEADLCIEVRDLTDLGAVPPPAMSVGSAQRLIFWNKSDSAPLSTPAAGIVGSAKTGAGVGELKRSIGRLARELAQNGEHAVIQRARHRSAITDAATALALWDDSSVAEEILASALDHAIRSLDAVVGATHVEHMLDIIFREFCIGK